MWNGDRLNCASERTLGEFEQIVMLALLHLGDNAYGMNIRREIFQRTSRDIAIGAVYTTLNRLEKKGYVSSWIGEASRERGGRAKRHFKIEAKGQEALFNSKSTMDQMWKGLQVAGA